jgi:hypothetical protein
VTLLFDSDKIIELDFIGDTTLINYCCYSPTDANSFYVILSSVYFGEILAAISAPAFMRLQVTVGGMIFLLGDEIDKGAGYCC